MNIALIRSATALAIAALLLIGVDGQDAAAGQAVDPRAPKTAAPVERLGPDMVRIGNVTVDTTKKEVSVVGTVLPAKTLEFIAVTKGGQKGYESALELETTAVNFNLGLILIGLDAERAVRPKFHLDPAPPSGDPVEVWIEWDEGGQRRKVRAEQLIYNAATKQTLSEGPWVYTGSVVRPNGAYLADIEGPLVGFVHTPAAVIDSPRQAAPGPYGANRINPALNLKPGTSVTLTVRALPRDKAGSAAAQ